MVRPGFSGNVDSEFRRIEGTDASAAPPRLSGECAALSNGGKSSDSQSRQPLRVEISRNLRLPPRAVLREFASKVRCSHPTLESRARYWVLRIHPDSSGLPAPVVDLALNGAVLRNLLFGIKSRL